MLVLNTICMAGFMALFASVSIFTVAKADANPKYIISDLGIINHVGSSATAINDQGEVIGTLGVGDSEEFSPQANHSFYWDKTLAHDMGRSYALSGINNQEQIVGLKYHSDYDLSDEQSLLAVSPVLYQDNQWISLLPKGANSGFPIAINDSGLVAGQLHLASSPLNKLTPAVWSKTDLHLLGVPASYISGIVKGMNNQGQAVGYLQKISSPPSSYDKFAVLWNNTEVTLLGSLPGGSQSQAVTINNRGHILCQSTSNWENFQKHMLELYEGKKNAKKQSLIFGGFLSDQGKLIAMVDPNEVVPGIDLSKGYNPRAMNDHDSVVGSASDSHGDPVAFIWEDNKMIDLNTLLPQNSGWRLTDAKGINNKGQIVGKGQIMVNGKYSGRTHAFLLSPT